MSRGGGNIEHACTHASVIESPGQNHEIANNNGRSNERGCVFQPMMFGASGRSSGLHVMSVNTALHNSNE